MTEQSREVDLGQASAGMELACDLVDARGTVLLQQGSVLSDSLLAALARRGVARLRVLGAPDGARDDGGDTAREQVDTRLAHLFRHGAEGALAELRTQLHRYRLESP